MNIDFKNIEENLIEKFKGGEGTMTSRSMTDKHNKIMMNKLKPGASIGYHSHDTNSEVMYFFSGKGHVDYDGTREEILPGIVHYCPKGHSHALYNDGNEDLVFLATVGEH